VLAIGDRAVRTVRSRPLISVGRIELNYQHMKIERALLSVSDKTGLAGLAQKLTEHNVEILSTGGTARFLREAGFPVVDVAEYTGLPEMLDGRVKTLHPKIHGGLLFDRGNRAHVTQAKTNGILPIDMLVVNLYPFEETVAGEGVKMDEAIEQIDIGGPAMLRAAAKNFRSVTVLTDPEDYDMVCRELDDGDVQTSQKTRETLATKAFERTAAYDAAISQFLRGGDESDRVTISATLDSELRYGDNPHQKARLYGNFSDYFEQLQGKELSYTNVLDIEAAAELISEFRRPTLAILKHTNPCGVGSDDEDMRSAWQKAFETDKQAPFGGVIVLNRPMSASLAKIISQIFTDVIIAPEFDAEARGILQKKKKLRLIRMAENHVEAQEAPVLRSVPGGFVIMDRDKRCMGLTDIEDKVVSKRPPTAEEIEAMRFALRIAKHVRSNAIVFAGKDRTLGIGAGQMSRIDSVRIAVWKAAEAGLSLDGSVVASDGLFPFADGLLAAAEAGATAAIQPGGSVRDEEVIAAADEKDMAMVMTGYRHFLH